MKFELEITATSMLILVFQHGMKKKMTLKMSLKITTDTWALVPMSEDPDQQGPNAWMERTWQCSMSTTSTTIQINGEMMGTMLNSKMMHLT